MMDTYFQLYSNCIIVDGTNQDAIYDLHRRRVFKLNNRISSLITNEFAHNSIAEVKSKFPDWIDGIDAYIGMLADQDYGHVTEEPHKFPPLSMEYHVPRHLESAIIVFNKDVDYRTSLGEMTELGCQFIQVIVTEELTDISMLKPLFSVLSELTVRDVEFIFSKVEVSLLELFKVGANLKFKYKIYGTSKDIKEAFKKLTDHQKDHFLLVEDLLDLNKAGSYGPEHMIVDQSFFIEAQKHNTGLNKKVCIDYDGNIRNYLNHPTIFGNISADKVHTVIQTLEFQEQWLIPNSKIEKCKKCIYRFACNSNSFVRQEDNNYYKDEDCKYNLEEDTWKNN